MEQEVEGRSLKQEANRTLAYYLEVRGIEWASVRQAISNFAPELGVDPAGRRRSDIAIECHKKIVAQGLMPPPNYVPPWSRGDRSTPRSSLGHRFPAVDRMSEVVGEVRPEAEIKAFYRTRQWRALRYEILRSRGAQCECCGGLPPQVIIHVDHIKPVRTYWHLRFEASNLQILCEECNLGKGSTDTTDWRSPAKRPVLKTEISDRARLVEDLKTANGGWTKDALAQIGVPWPPPKGWRAAFVRGEPIP